MARKHSLQGVLAEVLVLVFILATQIHAFSGGSGTRIDPYLIATAQDLMSIGSDPNLLQSHFRLVSDIDLDPNLPGGKVFDRAVIPPAGYQCTRNCDAAWGLGSEKLPLYVGAPFNGTLDGNGYEIANLVISGEGHLGLIGQVGPEGFVHDLVLSNVQINSGAGHSIAGLLTPQNEGVISNCHTKVNGDGLYSRSLVKFNHGIIQCCSATDRRIGKGGLVEYNSGFIRACYASVQQDSGSVSGGLVGWNAGTIIDCYAAGEFNSRCQSFHGAGGFVGINEMNIINCYAHTTTIAPDPQGCSSRVQADMRLGPFVGGNDGNSKSCYYAQTVLDNGIGVSLSDAAMRDVNSFADWEFYDGEPKGENNNWFMPEDHYPVLNWQTEHTGLVKIPVVQYKTQSDITHQFHRLGLTVGQVSYDYDGGIPVERAIRTDPRLYAALGSAVDIVLSQGPYDWADNDGSGSPESPFRISTAGEFDCLTHDSQLWDKHFVLTQDIDMRHCLYRRSPFAWDPNIFDTEFQGVPFSGGFDGAGFSIRGFTLIESDWSIYTGLFGYVDASAVIRNLGFDDVLLSVGVAGYYCGVLAGYNNGTVHDCDTHGIVTAGGMRDEEDGANCLGGLVGVNQGVVQDCHVGGTLMFGEIAQYVGGLVGENLGSIVHCSSSYAYLGGSGFSTGGLVGRSTGDLSHCWAEGPMTIGEGSARVGGLVGYVDATRGLRRGRKSRIKSQYGPPIIREYVREGNAGASVKQSYALCDVTSGNCCVDVGGLLGSGANVFDCYAMGRITAQHTSALGGLVGYADGSIKNSYVATDIAVEESFLDPCFGTERSRRGDSGGGLGIIIGEMDEDAEVADCFFLTYRGYSTFANGIGAGLSYRDLLWRGHKDFVGWDFVGETENGTEDIWFMPEHGYPPMLVWETQD